ncbi:MAG TPA: PsiF family protein [Steroidobacteraceae bacterium]|nr:PsiF family protein [Steroidobacteraceae bacterium]
MSILARTLLCCAALAAAAVHAAPPGGSAPGPVTARPPLQAMPATRVSRQVQQRMRACNAQADTRKLTAAPRESFIKGCMAVHRARHPVATTASHTPAAASVSRTPAAATVSRAPPASAPVH